MFALRVLSASAILLALAGEADAQRYSRRGVVVRAPYGGMMMSPYGGFSVRTPYYSYRMSPSAYVSPRGSYYARYGWPGVSVRVEGSTTPPSGQPVEAYSATPAAGPTPASTLDEAPLYTPNTAPQGDLVAQLEGALASLSATLGQFDGGAGWQRYFAMPQGAAADPAQRAKLQRRMESVTREPQFSAVAEIAEFQAVLGLLQQIAAAPAVSAPGPSLPPAPVGGEAVEAIPVPQSNPAPVQRPVSSNGERSVLQPN